MKIKSKNYHDKYNFTLPSLRKHMKVNKAINFDIVIFIFTWLTGQKTHFGHSCLYFTEHRRKLIGHYFGPIKLVHAILFYLGKVNVERKKQVSLLPIN